MSRLESKLWRPAGRSVIPSQGMWLPAALALLCVQDAAAAPISASETVSLDHATASTSPWTLTTPSNATIKVLAAVPGDAHAALQAAGIIGDVTYRFNDAEYAWVAGSPWTFSRPLPTLLSGAGNWTLVCEGLMTIGTVKLDGVALGQVNNQYRRWTFPIPAAIEDEQGAPRVLSLEFEPTQQFGLNVGCSRASAAAQSVRQEYLSWGNNGIEDYAQMNGTFPQGPWQSVYLVRSGATAPLIADVVPQITPRHGYPSEPLADSDNAWTVRTRVHLHSTTPSTAGTLTVSGNWSASASVSQAVTMGCEGDHNVTLELNATNMELWWPNSYGKQAMYELSVSFTPHGLGSASSAAGTATVSTTRRIGFRTIIFSNQMFDSNGSDVGYTGKPRLFYIVNGLPIFVRGANLVTVDVLESRVTAERYRNLLESAAAAHFNILRINGDANYMKDEFYAMADEFGVMIHNEMMFSDCDYSKAVQASYGSNDTHSFLPNAAAEVQHQVRRLAHHPCIALWLSNNEIVGPGGHPTGTRCLKGTERTCWQILFIDTIFTAVLAEDTSRSIWPDSMSDGWGSGVDSATNLRTSGPLAVRPAYKAPGKDREVHPYYFRATSCDCTSESLYEDPAYASEFGWMGLPSFDSWRHFSAAEDWGIGSPLMEHSGNKIVPVDRVAQRLAFNFPSEKALFAPDERGEASFRRVCYLSQLLAALCLRVESEHYRRGREFSPAQPKAAGTMGSMYWMFNSDYPSPSWGSVDVDGRWRLMHYFMRQSYSPLMVSAIATESSGSSGPKCGHCLSHCKSGQEPAGGCKYPCETGSSGQCCVPCNAPPSPPTQTCQPHFDMNGDPQNTIQKTPANSPAACCAECGTTKGCAAFTFDGSSTCWMTNVTSYHKADTRKPPITSGVCTGGACTKAACGKCTPFGPATLPSTRRLVVHVANDRISSGAFDASRIKLELISFADGQKHELSFTPVEPTVPANAGAVVYSQLVADVLKQAPACSAASDCFALATIRDRSHDDLTSNTGGLALLANFPNLSLKPANVTAQITATGLPAGSTHGVVLSSDVVALFVMVHSTLRGRWTGNGLLLLPDEPTTVGFMPWEAVPDAKAFGASLHVDVANAGSVVRVR